MGKSSRPRASQVLHPTPSELVNGMPGPDGVTVRLARPGDLDHIAVLADMAGNPLEEPMRAGIAGSATAATLLQALRTGSKAPLTRQVGLVLGGAGSEPFLGLSMVLVAIRSDEVVGALCALPPLGFISQLIGIGVPAPSAMATATAVAKIRSLAVDPQSRGHGIATHLLRTVVQIYDRIGLYLVYGTFDLGSGLENFYGSRGFQILPVGQRVKMDAIVGYPATLEAGLGDQMFTRWR